MQKENIIINSIEPVYERKTFVGMGEIIKQIGLTVVFDYKKMEGIKLAIQTDKIDGNEIKDKIIEVINS